MQSAVTNTLSRPGAIGLRHQDIEGADDASRPPLPVEDDQERILRRVQAVQEFLHSGFRRRGGEPAGDVVPDLVGGCRSGDEVGIRPDAIQPPPVIGGGEHADAPAAGIDHGSDPAPGRIEQAPRRADAHPQWDEQFGLTHQIPGGRGGGRGWRSVMT